MTSGLRDLLSRGRTWLWGLPALGWLVFCFWYTNTGGALSDDEIDGFTAMAERGGLAPEAVQRLRRFMQEDKGDSFLMVNLLEMASPDPDADLSPEESLGRYLEHMYPELLRRACHPVLAGPVVYRAMDLAGIEGADHWSDVGVMRYRSRRDIMEIAVNPIFNDRHEFKMAALAKTIAVPVEPVLYPGELRFVSFLALFFLVVIVDALAYRRRKPGRQAAP